jgi:hypothetical protein
VASLVWGVGSAWLAGTLFTATAVVPWFYLPAVAWRGDE